jgi:hypothetical protein
MILLKEKRTDISNMPGARLMTIEEEEAFMFEHFFLTRSDQIETDDIIVGANSIETSD